MTNLVSYVYAFSPVLIILSGFPYGVLIFIAVLAGFISWHLLDENAVWRVLWRH